MKLVPAQNGWLCPSDPGEMGRGKPRWSVNAIEARIVSELFRGLDVLEIGTGLGVATKEIAKRARSVYTVDIDEWVKRVVVPELPGNVYFFQDIKDVPKNLDAVFIDGRHTYKQCKDDIEFSKKIIKKDGLFVFHDAKMQDVLRAIVESNLVATYIDTLAGMAVAWNRGE